MSQSPGLNRVFNLIGNTYAKEVISIMDTAEEK